MQKKYSVYGMSCAACSSAVERAALSTGIVLSAEVSLLTNSLTVTMPEGYTDDAPLYEAVKKAGYTLAPFQRQKPVKAEKKSFLFYRLVFSVALLIPLFYICMGHMLHLPYPHVLMDEKLNTFLQILLVAPIVVLNFKFFTVGYPRLFRGHPNMDSLIALGATASIAYSVYASVQIFAFGRTGLMLYYESAGMILTFITIGKYLEERSKRKTGRTIEGLLQLAPETATVIENGVEKTVDSADLRAGDLILLRPGDRIPADGRVEQGASSVNEASMTGESIPRDVGVGDELRAGTVNLNGTLRLRAERVAGDTTLSKMIALVEQASAGKAPVGRLADRISGIFVPVIIGVSLISAAIWLIATKDFKNALNVGVTVLVIACPCSLGLATPAAIMAGTGKGAEFGVLFHSAEALENCGKVDTVVFDKTGTLTHGQPRLQTVLVRSGSENELLSALSALERSSEHPLAEAIVAETAARGIPFGECTDFAAMPGKGVSGRVNGAPCAALSLKSATEYSPGFALTEEEKEKLYGQAVIVFFRENEAVGAVGLFDRLKDDAARTVSELKALNIRTVLLSGDRKESAGKTGAEAGVDEVIAQVLPEDKEKEIARLSDAGKKAAMVGDGINDAPALARAYIGFAMGSGTDVAIESADVVLMNDRTLGVLNAILLSKRTLRTIKQNLFFAFFYNCIGVALAVSGIINPMFGAAAMSLSSFCVLTNALRLRRFRPVEPEASCPAVPAKTENDPKEKENNNMKKTLNVEGMMCMHCVRHVKEALEKIEGVACAEVSLEEKKAVVTLSADVPAETLIKAVADAGYEAREN